MQHHHPLEQADFENAMRTDGRHPDIFPELPVGLRKILVAETLALFEYQHGIPFFNQALDVVILNSHHLKKFLQLFPQK
jgi:hypothetical protein